MTRQRNLKRLVRAHMAKTGQRYAAARRTVLSRLDAAEAGGPVADGFWHLPGTHPECAALRILLANAGVTAPHTGQAPSEELVFGIAGGAGAAVMAFRYEREDLSNFWITGWNPFQSSVLGACERLGITPTVTETAGPRAAERQLEALLAEGVPAMAWVDLAELGYAGLPAAYSGGSYHTVVVYRHDPTAGSALLGDRADRPVEVPAETLTRARSRIRKFRHRLLSLGPDEPRVDVVAAVRAGLLACAAGPVQAPNAALSIEGVKAWAAHLHGGQAKESWARRFPPGVHLWGALRNLYNFVEHYGSGGGLMRPLHARFLREAAVLADDQRLDGLAGRYQALGGAWTGLARAALPDEVPAFRATRELLDRADELFLHRGAAAGEEIRGCWEGLEAIGGQMGERFPLDRDGTDALLAGLQARVRAIHAEEVAALETLRALVGR